MTDAQFWSIEVEEKSSECITSVISVWADSLGLKLCELTFLSGRGGEFTELSAYLKDHVKSASHHPEDIGKIERGHKELGMMCGLYESQPLLLLSFGDLDLMECLKSKRCLREDNLCCAVFKKGLKSGDTWGGPLIVQKQRGASMVRCLNLETKRTVLFHINDLKVYQRPCTSNWKLSDKMKAELCAQFDVTWTDFDELSFE